jgi:hypothetical protein
VLQPVRVRGVAGVELDDDVDLERLRPLLLLRQHPDDAHSANAGQFDAVSVDGGPPRLGSVGRVPQLALPPP